MQNIDEMKKNIRQIDSIEKLINTIPDITTRQHEEEGGKDCWLDQFPIMTPDWKEGVAEGFDSYNNTPIPSPKNKLQTTIKTQKQEKQKSPEVSPLTEHREMMYIIGELELQNRIRAKSF